MATTRVIVKDGIAGERAVERLKRLIFTGDLTGEQLRQEDMAQRLAVSRPLVHKALRALATQGLIEHRPHQGFFVAKRAPVRLAQIMLMLDLLEPELMRSMTQPSPAVLGGFEELNQRMEELIDEWDNFETLTLNREFHFLLFDESPLPPGPPGGRASLGPRRTVHLAEAVLTPEPVTRRRGAPPHHGRPIGRRSRQRSRRPRHASNERAAGRAAAPHPFEPNHHLKISDLALPAQTCRRRHTQAPPERAVRLLPGMRMNDQWAGTSTCTRPSGTHSCRPSEYWSRAQLGLRSARRRHAAPSPSTSARSVGRARHSVHDVGCKF